MSDPLEMARCAEINLDNLFSTAPFLKSHPIGMLLKMQISECVAGLEAAEHSVHPTGGILPDFLASLTPEQLSALKVLLTPPTSG